MNEDDFLEAQYEDRFLSDEDLVEGMDEPFGPDDVDDELEELIEEDEEEPPATGTPEWHPSFGYAPNLKD